MLLLIDKRELFSNPRAKLVKVTGFSISEPVVIVVFIDSNRLKVTLF